MSEFFLNEKNASKTRLKEAENARKNRAEFVSAYSQGRISRRDLVKLGLISSAGLIVPKQGLSPLQRARSELHSHRDAGVTAGSAPLNFRQPMPRFDLRPQADSQRDRRDPSASAWSVCTDRPGQHDSHRDGRCSGRWHGADGRPSAGTDWAHQRLNEFLPQDRR